MKQHMPSKPQATRPTTTHMSISTSTATSSRQLDDAHSGSSHPPLRNQLLILLLLVLPLVASKQTATGSPQRREWRREVSQKSDVALNPLDGMAMSSGTGRKSRDVFSITRGLPVQTDAAAPCAAVDVNAIKFTPPEIELGRLETCFPVTYYVKVENHGRVAVTFDRAGSTYDGFSLVNNVRGIRLDPGDGLHLQLGFLPHYVEPNGLNAYLRFVTSSGQFSLPLRSPEVVLNRYGVKMCRASLPVGTYFEQLLLLKNSLSETIRVTEIYARDSFVNLEPIHRSDQMFHSQSRGERSDRDYITNTNVGQHGKELDHLKQLGRGACDVPAGTTSSVVKVSVEMDTPGVHLSYVDIVATDKLLLSMPVCITILKPGIHIEPDKVDLGVLTDLYEGHKLFFSLYNADVNPIEIVELEILKTSKLIVTAQLRGSAVVPPQTRAYHALAVQLRVDKDIISGRCIASLLLKTNASIPELRHRKLRLYGHIVKGHLAFELNETFVKVMMPPKSALSDNDKKAVGVTEVNGSERIVTVDERSPANVVSIVSKNDSMATVAGTSHVRNITLWNRFDCPIELQRVWVNDARHENDDHQELVVHKFEQGIVSVGASLPNIVLQITPTFEDQGKLPTPRLYWLMIQTNATLHRIPIHVYQGFLTLNSTRRLHTYPASGHCSNVEREQESTQPCLLVPNGSLATDDINAVHVCRSLLLDLNKVASHEARMEMVEAINENPVPQTLLIMQVCNNDTVDVSIAAEILKAGGFSHVPHRTGAAAAGVVDKWTNSTNFVTAGDSFVLQPGYRVVFHIKIKAKDILGEITVPVVSITTQSEVVHLYARFVSVRGTVEPVTPIIVLPMIFPSRLEAVRLQYRNTLDHVVTSLVATVSSSKLHVLSMEDNIALGQAESVLDLMFSPWEDFDCVGALFLMECLFPSSVSAEEKCYHLSDYGGLVTQQDLEALDRRDKFWSEQAATHDYSNFEAQVRLQTDIVNDVADVTIKAIYHRPMMTVPAETKSNVNNETLEVSGRIEFALTEVYKLSYIFVHVQNPSNFSISMELTHSEADRHLFYNCEEELIQDLVDVHSGEEYHDPDYISKLCLLEWKAAMANAAQGHSRQEVDLPIFYYKKKVFKASAGKKAQLGPIFYLPSKVQEVSTRVFVRNDLTHIEPISLLARSGKGTLDVSVAASTEYKSAPLYHSAYESAAVSEDEKATQRSVPVDKTLRFALTTHDASTDFSQVADVVLSNTGPCGLTIRNVTVEPDDHTSWTQLAWTSDLSRKSAFVVTSDNYTGSRDDIGITSNVLAPGEAAMVQVSFYATCFTVNLTSWLVVDTSDVLKRIRLEGTIATDAAFRCWHSRMSSSMRLTLFAIWVLAVVVAVIVISYTMFILGHDAWTSGLHLVNDGQPGHLNMNANHHNTKVVREVSAHEKDEESSTTTLGDESCAVTERALASITRVLADMEQVSSASAARVVMPAVAELLERRRRESQSAVRNRSPQKDQLSKNDKVGKDSQKGKATAKAATHKIVSPRRDRVPASDVASAAMTASVQTVQPKVANKASSTNTYSLRNATQPATAPRQGFRYSSEKSGQSLEKKPPECLLRPISSSCPATVRTDANEVHRTARFLKVSSIDDSNRSHYASVRFASVTTSSLAKKEESSDMAFKSLSARWRAENERDNLKNSSRQALLGKFPASDEWRNDMLSFNSLAHGLVGPRASEHRCDNNVRSSHGLADSFIGTGTGLYLNGFPAPSIPLPAKATPKLATTKDLFTTAVQKKAPPGFTQVDASPFQAQAAFEHLQTSRETAMSIPSVSSSFSSSSLFANKPPLFGPPLRQNSDHVKLESAGCIGSGRSKYLRSVNVQQGSTK